MTTEHPAIQVSTLQLGLRAFCVWIENQFELRATRLEFLLRVAPAALALGALVYTQRAWLADAGWPARALVWIAAGGVMLAGIIIPIVRRFHDLGRTGGLFWALAVPYWALWKLTGLFPGLWWVWVLLCAWPIWLTLQLFGRPGVAGGNRYPRVAAQN